MIGDKFNIRHCHYCGGLYDAKRREVKRMCPKCDEIQRVQVLSFKKNWRYLVVRWVLSDKCQKCGQVAYIGNRVALTLDHIDANPMNNKLANYQFLCNHCNPVKGKGTTDYRPHWFRVMMKWMEVGWCG